VIHVSGLRAAIGLSLSIVFASCQLSEPRSPKTWPRISIHPADGGGELVAIHFRDDAPALRFHCEVVAFERQSDDATVLCLQGNSVAEVLVASPRLHRFIDDIVRGSTLRLSFEGPDVIRIEHENAASCFVSRELISALEHETDG